MQIELPEDFDEVTLRAFLLALARVKPLLSSPEKQQEMSRLRPQINQVGQLLANDPVAAVEQIRDLAESELISALYWRSRVEIDSYQEEERGKAFTPHDGDVTLDLPPPDPLENLIATAKKILIDPQPEEEASKHESQIFYVVPPEGVWEI